MNPLSSDSSPNLPLAKRPRRWRLRLLFLVGIIAIIWASRNALERRGWGKFRQEVEVLIGSIDEWPHINPPFANWPLDWCPRWILSRPPVGRMIVVVTLSDKKMNDGWLRRHADAIRLPRLTTIHLQNDEITDAGLRVLRDHPTLEELNVSGEQYSADCLAELGGLPNLRGASIPQVALSESSVRQLAKCPNLIELTCHGDSPGLSQLGSLKGLQSLTLLHASDDSLRRIPASCPVLYLSLCETTMTDAAIPDLLKLPQLQKIEFASHSSLSKEGLKRLKAAGIKVNDTRGVDIQ